MKGAATDNILLERLKKGDATAFRQIYERYWTQLYKACYYYTHAKEDTEDMVVAIFTSLWAKRETLDIAHLEGYLQKAAKYQSLNFLLSQHHRRTCGPLALTAEEIPAGEEDSPERLLEAKEYSWYIHHQVEALPEKTKRIFLLNREGGLSYKEIARALGVSVKTVEYHMSKARSSLARCLPLLAAFLARFL